MRYLGWGEHNQEAIDAAKKRSELVQAAKRPPVKGGEMNEYPAKMGPYSGYNGFKGQRLPPPPQLFVTQAPSKKDLGLREDVDTSDWPLHIKETGALVSRFSEAESRSLLLPYQSPSN